MGKIRIGILGTADIAFRRFLPALLKCSDFEYVGIASRKIEKTKSFVENFGGKEFDSYESLLADANIDAVYIPLPPAFHFEWGYKALKNGKHVLMEKPFTTKVKDTQKLIDLAQKNHLAVHENYMFLYHSQLKYLKHILKTGKIGELRQIRIAFGFPKRSAGDFRYNKVLGGGALLDCGGYTIRLASELLGKTTKVVYSKLNSVTGSEVDIFGSAMLVNDEGITAQVTFGMDNGYKCEVELWGSKGSILFPRIFTAPTDFRPRVIFEDANGQNEIAIDADDQFLHSIEIFGKCTYDDEQRRDIYRSINQQSLLIDKMLW